MAYSTQLLIMLVIISFCYCKKCENCDKYGVLIYEDIGCKPVHVHGKKCPRQYDCDLSQPKSGCLFKGEIFGFNEPIPSNLTSSACQPACFCDDSSNIICAILDCAEYFGPGPEPGCYNGYELGKCCSTGPICNATETKTCEVDGESYKIGQKFVPKNTCLQCVCHKNFTGEYDEATCARRNCATQVRYGSEISQYCAPAYFKYDTRTDEAYCCPDHFVCPDPSDKIKLVNCDADQDSGLECTYGEKKLKLGEGLRRKVDKYGKERDLQCECIVPPLLTCKEL